MNVQAVMSQTVKYCGSGASLASAAALMAKNDCGAIPVVDSEHRVIGMITDRDICLAIAKIDRLPSVIPVSEVMSKNVVSCGPEDDVHTALETMRDRKVRRLPVVDTEGQLRGIVSMDDIVIHAERGTGKTPPEIGYGATVRTLKAIYARKGNGKGLVIQP